MKSPAKERLYSKELVSLFENLIYSELHAIIYSKEYKDKYVDLSHVDRKKIKENQRGIASQVTKFFMDSGGADETDDLKINKLIQQAISKALKV